MSLTCFFFEVRVKRFSSRDFFTNLKKKLFVAEKSYLKTSKTNFSILIPFGWAGLTMAPLASTKGIFFLATWWVREFSFFITTRSKMSIYIIKKALDLKLYKLVREDAQNLIMHFCILSVNTA